MTVTPGVNSITIDARGSTDVGSGIKTYYFSKDGGVTWKTSNSFRYTFMNLNFTLYSIQVKVVDQVGNVSNVVSEMITPLSDHPTATKMTGDIPPAPTYANKMVYVPLNSSQFVGIQYRGWNADDKSGSTDSWIDAIVYTVNKNHITAGKKTRVLSGDNGSGFEEPALVRLTDSTIGILGGSVLNVKKVSSSETDVGSRNWDFSILKVSGSNIWVSSTRDIPISDRSYKDVGGLACEGSNHCIAAIERRNPTKWTHRALDISGDTITNMYVPFEPGSTSKLLYNRELAIYNEQENKGGCKATQSSSSSERITFKGKCLELNETRRNTYLYYDDKKLDVDVSGYYSLLALDDNQIVLTGTGFNFYKYENGTFVYDYTLTGINTSDTLHVGNSILAFSDDSLYKIVPGN